MGGELLESEGIYEGDDEIKPADDQDVCEDARGAQEKDGEEDKNLVEVLSTTVRHYFPKFNQWLAKLTDVRNQDLITYARETIIWAALIALITKRQSRMNISHQMREGYFCHNLKNLCEQERLENERQRRSHQERLTRRKPEHTKRKRITETTHTWMKGIEFSQDRSLFNVMTCKEVVDGQTMCDYVWIVSDGLNLSEETVKPLTKAGRCRWTIENEGINTQKNGGYRLEHLYSRDKVSMKIWCALIDIAHLINQLIEQGSLIAIKTYGSIRNISQRMFEHLRYYVFRKPPNPPRIQIRLGWNTS